jgi:hypothetical protein
MHARIDQLLSLRDGAPVDAEIRAHVQHCAQCLAEAALLAKTRERLQALPSLAPPADLFAQISARAAAPAPRRRSFRVIAAAAAVVVVVVTFVAVRDRSNAPPIGETQFVATPVVQQHTPDEDMLKLIAQSRQLDEVLQYLPVRPQVERVSFAATVDSLEERIQMVDLQLAYGSDAGLDRAQAHRLWSERVELMDSLVKVRYAESAPMAF